MSFQQRNVWEAPLESTCTTSIAGGDLRTLIPEGTGREQGYTDRQAGNRDLQLAGVSPLHGCPYCLYSLPLRSQPAHCEASRALPRLIPRARCACAPQCRA